jgi:hypothetical protein
MAFMVHCPTKLCVDLLDSISGEPKPKEDTFIKSIQSRKDQLPGSNMIAILREVPRPALLTGMFQEK